MKAMNKEVTCCPICIIKHPQHVGSESFFISDRCTSTKDHCIHQALHHQIIPNTIHHFRIKEFESSLNPTMSFIPSNMDQYPSATTWPSTIHTDSQGPITINFAKKDSKEVDGIVAEQGPDLDALKETV